MTTQTAKRNRETEMFSFKSSDIFFDKEREGIKNNTVREIDLEDNRFINLIMYNTNGYNSGDLQIRITRANNNEDFFIRDIKDISIYKNLMIITWEDKNDL